MSLWEISTKVAAGRMRVPEDLRAKIAESSFADLDVTHDHAWAAGRLPRHHRDPIDRILVAQAQLQGLTIATRDRQIALYQVALLPA